mmetsp:Transcript_115582/g.331814  ORF Transcript_115582/g.331814 Transcript_115582/m.331814 type:complete len:369 (-) Transcript_115582:1038-2144(-)
MAEAHEDGRVRMLLSQDATDARLGAKAERRAPFAASPLSMSCGPGDARMAGSDTVRRRRLAGIGSSPTSMNVFFKRYSRGSISDGEAMQEEATAKPRKASPTLPEATKIECRCGWCTERLTIVLDASFFGTCSTPCTNTDSTFNTSSLCWPLTSWSARTWTPSLVYTGWSAVICTFVPSSSWTATRSGASSFRDSTSTTSTYFKLPDKWSMHKTCCPGSTASTRVPAPLPSIRTMALPGRQSPSPPGHSPQSAGSGCVGHSIIGGALATDFEQLILDWCGSSTVSATLLARGLQSNAATCGSGFTCAARAMSLVRSAASSGSRVTPGQTSKPMKSCLPAASLLGIEMPLSVTSMRPPGPTPATLRREA